MADFELRKTFLALEEIHHDDGPKPTVARKRGAILAVVRNPFAGRFEPDLQSAMDDLKPLGLMMSEKLIAALGGAEGIDGYGKGSIIGAGGELEHGAMWHVPGGYAMRQLLGDSNAIVPSSTKVGGMGARLDVPTGHINAAYVRSHFDAMEVGLSDAPRADEIVYALVMTCGPRVNSRMGGLESSDIVGKDGLR